MISRDFRIALRLAAIPLLSWCVNANANTDSFNRVLALGGGLADVDNHAFHSTSTGTQEGAEPDASQLSLSYDNGQFYTIAAGVQERNIRVMVEFYRTELNISIPETAPADEDEEQAPELATSHERTTQLLYYSGYWRPEIIWGVRAVAGAGIGWGQQRLNWGSGEDRQRFSARGWSGKLSLGLEYQVTPRLGVYALAESISFNSLTEEEQTAASNDQFRLDRTSQNQFGFGIHYLF